MLDGFNDFATNNQAYIIVMAWILSALVINSIVRIVMFFISREIVGNLVLTAIAMTTVVGQGAFFSRLPGAYTVDPVLYYLPIARLISYVAAIILAVAGWAMTFKLIKIELKQKEQTNNVDQ